MKRYFLIIVLFSLMFLGLGNTTMGQTDTTPVDCASQDSDIATYQLSYDQCLSTCNATLPPLALRNPDQEYTDCQAECIQQYQGLQSHKAMYDHCVSEGKILCTPAKANAHISSLLTCVCDDGYKDVDGICKPCSEKGVCCGVELNTTVPFIGKCIESDTGTAYTSPDETGVTGSDAFPVLMGSLTKILVTLILITSFVLIIVGGIMIATGDPSGGKKMIINVAIGIALLGASGVILRLINPNFFG